MLKTIGRILFSTRLTACLFILFAAAMATGTLLDANQLTSPTAYTRTLIYNAWWFEAIMWLFVINFVGNIFRYQLFKRKKWATLTLHLAFIIILIGAFVTRYNGFEGVMSIREGTQENTFLSQKTYLTIKVDGDYKIDSIAQRLSASYEVDFSERLNNSFKKDLQYDQQPITVSLDKFVAGAEKDIIPDPKGEYYLKMVEASGGKPHNHFLKLGETQSIHNLLFALNNPTKGAINITYNDNNLTIESPFEGEYLTMATGTSGLLVKDSVQTLKLRSRYIIDNLQLVFPKPVIKGVFEIVKKSKLLKNDEDGLVLTVTTNGESKKVQLLGGKGFVNKFEEFSLGGLDFNMRYGSKILELPFGVQLHDFKAKRYPGTTNSYSAFSSDVTVIDPESGNYDYSIYMNNILDHRGYRFFQSSYHPDEKGTILSVNHDYWGTWITYIGYFLLFFGMLTILFSKHSRFASVRKQLNALKDKKATLYSIFILGFVMQTYSQSHTETHKRPTPIQIDSILEANITPKAHANLFGELVIQDLSGRMMPVNTYASELLRKLSKKDTYNGFNANQILLSIQESQTLWYNIPIIYLKPRKGDSIRRIINVPKSQKYVAVVDFLNPDLSSKIEPYLNDAYRAKIPNAFQKEFIDVDNRINLLLNAISGRTLKLFPVPNEPNNTWVSSFEYHNHKDKYPIKDSLYGNFIGMGFRTYLSTLNHAKQTNDYTIAEKILEGIKSKQKKYGGAVMLSDEKIKTEILYDKYDIFKKLFSWYLYFGMLLFIIVIIQLFCSKSFLINNGVTVLKIGIFALFILHTLGLIVRWYISGHAPWSDAYESMIYVAWATMLFGLVFGRKSTLTLASAAFITSMILMIAHRSWLDPAIANLQPVLNSYWLMIHVAVIVASYGPFTLGMILGITSLGLMIMTTSTNYNKIKLRVTELTLITEMALTVGLIMLTIGNFLGGMWANESWGRYWGWDPKETWALISIMIYAFVIHMRLVPGLRSRWWFNLCAILAFASIMMTYFGVNFYLSGLHSYASGDKMISYQFILISLFIIAVLGVFSYRKYIKYYRK